MDWGPQDGPVVVAWHGLARTGRDMDELATHFAAKGFRVVCPDTIGRGLSQWSPVPDDEYQLSFYARLAEAVCDALELDRIHWVGTSMGGAIGTVCAAGLTVPRVAFFRAVHKPYGWLSDAQWLRLTETSTRRLPQWDAIEAPVLLLRGVDSDLVRPELRAGCRGSPPYTQRKQRLQETPWPSRCTTHPLPFSCTT